MKTPSFFELKTIVEYVSDELEGAQLQEVFSTEEGLVLGFYCFQKKNKMSYLVFDLDRPFPFLALFESNPWAKQKKTKPLALFLNAHAKNQHFNKIIVCENLGRVIHLYIGFNDTCSIIEFRLIPKQVNLIVHFQKKSISWYPVKPLAQNDQQYTQNPEGEEIRSLAFLMQQWSRRRASFQSSTDVSSKNSLSPFEKWIKSREKDLEKKKKALLAVQEQIKQYKNEEWALVGEHLKINGFKNLKPEWSVYVDFVKSVSTNMQKCFEKAKSAKVKILGAQARLAILKQEVIDCENRTEENFLLHLQKQSQKSKKVTPQNLEGRLRKSQTTDSGVVAYMGKSAADNINLLRSSKPNDLWLHLKDYPSAHAVIQRQKNQNLSDEDINKFCKWLVKEGLSDKQLQLGGRFAVVIVECRHVKPLKGDKMGRVTYHNAREVLIAL